MNQKAKQGRNKAGTKRKTKFSSRTHNVRAIAAAELVHAVGRRAAAADAPGVRRIAGSADVAGEEGAFGGWAGCYRGGHEGREGEEGEAGEGELYVGWLVGGSGKKGFCYLLGRLSRCTRVGCGR